MKPAQPKASQSAVWIAVMTESIACQPTRPEKATSKPVPNHFFFYSVESLVPVAAQRHHQGLFPLARWVQTSSCSVNSCWAPKSGVPHSYPPIERGLQRFIKDLLCFNSITSICLNYFSNLSPMRYSKTLSTPQMLTRPIGVLFHWPKSQEIKLVGFPIPFVRQFARYLTWIHGLRLVV